MDLKQIVILGLQISIVSTVFGYGLRTTAADLLFAVKRPGQAYVKWNRQRLSA